MISVIKNRKIWFSASGLLVVISIIAFSLWGLKFGIDFTGGSLLEIEYSQVRPDIATISTALNELQLGEVTVQPTGELGTILRFRDVDEPTHQAILEILSRDLAAENSIEESRFDSIGPIIGQELKRKSLWAMSIVLVAIIAYVAWAFRKVSKPVASWRYGLIAVIALFHDVIITIGVFSVLGVVYGVEINAAFIAALLTILGYSVNDSIVVFDRIRENLLRRIGDEFETIVESSIQEVITRSINTSFTTLVVLFSILLFGGATIRNFAFALIIGVGIGTYSSIFLASPLLVVFEKFKKE